jgi:hypothetical protein
MESGSLGGGIWRDDKKEEDNVVRIFERVFSTE